MPSAGALTSAADAAPPGSDGSQPLAGKGEAPKLCRVGIVIKSLKNSAVFEETVRQVEEEARRRQAERAQRYEDGELTDSSSGSPSSPTPCRPAVEGEVKSDGEIASEGEATGSGIEEPRIKGVGRKAKKSHKKSHDTSSHRKRRHHSRARDGSRSSSRRTFSGGGDRPGSRRDRSSSPRYDCGSRTGSRRRAGARARRSRRSRSRSRSRDRTPDRADLRERIDKRRLLEVARQNALRLGEEGRLPAGLESAAVDARRETTRDLHQLTEMCRRLREEAVPRGARPGSDDEAAFYHPFAVRERPSHIVMKIRNAPQLPVKSHAERQAQVMKLNSQFPVSSGEQHRTKELEWVPVVPAAAAAPEKPTQPAAVVPSTTEREEAPAPEPPPVAATPPASTDSVFPDPRPAPELDLNAIVSRRLTALRQLQQDPHNAEAQHLITSAQQDMQSWATSRHQPGQFNGSTGARVLSVAELSAGQQAWAKKNQLKSSLPVRGGMGEMLLKKMGWEPGQGLGKNKDGSLTPLLLDVKMDKKGLVSEDERPGSRRQPQVTLTNVKDLTGKHPISALMELCTKRRWGPPNFELSFDSGPSHQKHFLYKVTVNDVTYQPSADSPNKKLAKASAAAACLQALGLLPRQP
ncbi:protein SON-like [Pollicipes pollicipes]|uniref:protein SON-like n=1 Tax=Pollicipes pollicipes TaxID=41117 RepID=UPI001884D2DF|nr:protein SON-like [Pollicipes pollicipes]